MTWFVAVSATAFGCGHGAGTDGKWVVTRLLADHAGCAVTDDFEQMVMTIDGEQVTINSPGITLQSSRVYQVDDRNLVELSVIESWYANIEGGFPIGAPVTYSFELVPATGRLEGTAASEFDIDTSSGPATCDFSGTASAGRVAD